MRILIVEDELEMLQLLRDGLREHGHTVMTAATGEEGLDLALAHSFDVIVLDVLLPRMDGRSVARALRNRPGSPAAKILMLSACDREDQIIDGLDMGADDYMTKPFSFVELLARLRSITRSVDAAFEFNFRTHDLVFDLRQRHVSRAGRSIDLTRTELALLEILMRSPGQTVARSVLIDAVWGGPGRVGATSLDAFMNLLRNKIDAPFEQRLIQTVRGVGYRIGLDAQQNVLRPREFRSAVR